VCFFFEKGVIVIFFFLTKRKGERERKKLISDGRSWSDGDVWTLLKDTTGSFCLAVRITSFVSENIGDGSNVGVSIRSRRILGAPSLAEDLIEREVVVLVESSNHVEDLGWWETRGVHAVDQLVEWNGTTCGLSEFDSKVIGSLLRKGGWVPRTSEWRKVSGFRIGSHQEDHVGSGLNDLGANEGVSIVEECLVFTADVASDEEIVVSDDLEGLFDGRNSLEDGRNLEPSFGGGGSNDDVAVLLVDPGDTEPSAVEEDGCFYLVDTTGPDKVGGEGCVDIVNLPRLPDVQFVGAGGKSNQETVFEVAR
jgi:hypothetical protein